MTEENANLDRIERNEDDTTKFQPDTRRSSPKEADGDLFSHPPLMTVQNHKKALLQCLLLEIGILFHSVFIGMALSMAIGNEFIVLLIAITFHREYSSDSAHERSR